MQSTSDRQQRPAQARRGFAGISKEQRAAIASMGGKAISQDKAHMARLGGLGGRRRALNRRVHRKAARPTVQLQERIKFWQNFSLLKLLVAEALRPASSVPRAVSTTDGMPPKANDAEPGGTVNLFKFGRFYKLVAATDEKKLSTRSVERLDFIHRIHTDDPEGIANYWRARFAPQGWAGDWFELNPTEVRAFTSRRTM
jgi:hypothetical protein